jgi:Pyruvate/2-oxoacid:ferredoxin oxidoreductase gamma subunit
MFETLLHLRRAIAADGWLVYVVGNSLHGGRGGEGLVIAADLLIARLAELAGFTVSEMAVARVPSRRRTFSPYLRESVVFARAGESRPGSARG